MNLFVPSVDDEKLHPNFRSFIDGRYKAEQDGLSACIEGSSDRDGKFVKEFQTTFNSSFWEIYLYRLFQEMGFKFDWSFASPDFALQRTLLRVIILQVSRCMHLRGIYHQMAEAHIQRSARQLARE